MAGKKMLGVVTLIGLAAVLYGGYAHGQQAPDGEGRRDGGRFRRENTERDGRLDGQRPDQGGRAGAGQWNPQMMQERQVERIKETIEATDEDWTALKPLVEKVVTLSAQTGGAGMMMMRAQMARPGGSGERTAAATQNPVQRATQELQQALANPDATAREIGDKLLALRQVREKSEKDLQDARNELKELLTQRQEARLVLSGLLR